MVSQIIFLYDNTSDFIWYKPEFRRVKIEHLKSYITSLIQLVNCIRFTSSCFVMLLLYVEFHRKLLQEHGINVHVYISNFNHHWFKSRLVTCSASSHYLNHCWLINWPLRNIFCVIFFEILSVFSNVCKMAAILSQPQCVLSWKLDKKNKNVSPNLLPVEFFHTNWAFNKSSWVWYLP